MINVLRWSTRIAGLGALVLGATFLFAPGWFASSTLPLSLHMTLGGIVAVVLAILAGWALIHRVKVPAAIVALVWAAAVIYVGTVQDWWVGADSHVAMEIIHPLLGIGAIG